jgi:hypothetical protein
LFYFASDHLSVELTIQEPLRVCPVKHAGNILPNPHPTQWAIYAHYPVPEFAPARFFVKVSGYPVIRPERRKTPELSHQQWRFVGRIEHQVDLGRTHSLQPVSELGHRGAIGVGYARKVNEDDLCGGSPIRGQASLDGYPQHLRMDAEKFAGIGRLAIEPEDGHGTPFHQNQLSQPLAQGRRLSGACRTDEDMSFRGATG